MNFSKLLIKTVLATLTAAIPAQAGMLTVDEYLLEGNPGNSAILSGTVDMSVSGDLMTIILTNTSSGISLDGPGATNLLTGVGFTLPGSVTILSGTATVAVGAVNNFPLVTDVSTEWGFRNGNPIASGHFSDPAVLSYNNAVSTMQSDFDTKFAAGFIDNPLVLGGPEFGLVTDFAFAGGLNAIFETITINVTLSSSVAAGSEAGFISDIDANAVALEFASPDQSTIPEPSSMLLFSIGGIGLACFARRKRSDKSQDPITPSIPVTCT